MKNLTDLLGRMLLSFIFLYEAYDIASYVHHTKGVMMQYGIVWRQELLIYGAITFLSVGGLMILSGYRAKLGAFFAVALLVARDGHRSCLLETPARRYLPLGGHEIHAEHSHCRRPAHGDGQWNWRLGH